MLKRYLFLWIAVCLLSFCATANGYVMNDVITWTHTPSDIEKLGLKGNVQSISQRIYEASKSKDIVQKKNLLLDPTENWNIDFNKKGYIIQKQCLGADSEIVFYYDYNYKKQSVLQEKIMYDSRDYTIEKVNYTYYELGQLAAESIYRGDKSLLVRYIHNYNNKGQLIRTDVHAPTPQVYTCSRYEFLYNKEGQLIEQKTFDNQEKLNQTDSYSYDKQGFLKEHEIKNHRDDFLFTEHSRYDERGNLITFQAATEKTPITSYTYTFDEQGNWITRTHYKNGKVEDIVERTIQYKK